MTYTCKNPKCGNRIIHNGTLGGTGPLAIASFELHSWVCAKCGRVNNVKRKPKKP